MIAALFEWAQETTGVSPETVGIGAIAIALITILSIFVRSLVKRQDSLIRWFTDRFDHHIESLQKALDSNRQATEHNTRNLKAMQELSTKMIDTLVASNDRVAKEFIDKMDEVSGQVSVLLRRAEEEGG